MSHFRPHETDSLETPMPRSPRRRSRAGHTLIEILLALGLSLVILTAVYAALDQHWRYADAGQRQTERMQVTRALFERLSLDVRSVVFRRVAGPELPMRASDVTRIDVVQPDELYVGRSIGIVGDGQKLVLQIDAPSGERPVAPQSVRWEIRAASAPGQGTLGLARIARDTASLEAAMNVSPQDLLAEEVETIRFRYFARGSWFEQWDSVERQELPQAVEIMIGFRRASAAEPTTSGQTSPGEYRLIVPVPASEA
ncbi:MAG: prepilin-type N-terminal cleavage/methylation domain-containing protein [Planctomycetota bacterium]|nr:prepilin-type N-terminal cleavage/methylation domain-containing protein [Planctomycetota bacterium]